MADQVFGQAENNGTDNHNYMVVNADGSINNLPGTAFLQRVILGLVPGYSIINKFGRNAAVPNGGIAPVSIGGVWPTPTALTSLEIVSDDAADTAAGVGARKCRIWGIGVGYVEVVQDVEMSGLTPVALATGIYRITRVKVIESGTYANPTTSSQKGTITVQESGAGAAWAMVDEAVSTFGVGQSQIGQTTIPLGSTGLLLSKKISVDALKAAKVYFFTRESIDTVVAPFSGMNLKEQDDGVQGVLNYNPDAPMLVIPEKTDCGFMALGDGQATSVSVDFQILLIDNDYIV